MICQISKLKSSLNFPAISDGMSHMSIHCWVQMDTQGDECLPSVHTQPNIQRGFHQQCWHRDNKWEVEHNLPRGWLYNPLTSSSWQISVSLLLRAPLTSATSLSSSEQWSCAPSSSWMATLAVSSCCVSCLTRCCEEDCTSSRSRRVLSREAFRDVASDSNCVWVWGVFVWGVCVCGMWCVWYVMCVACGAYVDRGWAVNCRVSRGGYPGIPPSLPHTIPKVQHWSIITTRITSRHMHGTNYGQLDWLPP